MYSPHLQTIRLQGGRGSSVPLLQAGLAELIPSLFRLATRWVLVVDRGIPPAQLRGVQSLPRHWELVEWMGGEGCKTGEQKALLEDRLLSLPLDPSWGICVLGGGALLDLVGYVASGIYRGLRLVLVPTTLLAMVDASIGSKNGINHPQGKNLLGTLFDPVAVFLDPSWVLTLPLHLIQQGAAEMIKHAWIGSREQLDPLSQMGHQLLSATSSEEDPGGWRQRERLREWILPNLLIKNRAVQRSLVSPEWRHLLNAGHTVAHGWEAALNYQISHGEAVGSGLWVEACLAQDLGYVSAQSLQALEGALRAWRFQPPVVEWERVVPYWLRDKKNEAGRLLLSLPHEQTPDDLWREETVFHRTEVSLAHLKEVYQRCQLACV